MTCIVDDYKMTEEVDQRTNYMKFMYFVQSVRPKTDQSRSMIRICSDGLQWRDGVSSGVVGSVVA